MLRRAALLIVALLAFAPLATTNAQEDVPVVLKLEGHEGPLECDPTAAQILCFKTIEGDPATAFSAGATVRVELTAMPLEGAPAGAPHNLVVGIDGTQGDLQGIDSDNSEALGVSEVAESGSTVTLEFTVPETGTLYFWCDVGEHEAIGMRFTSEVQPADDGGNETNETGDDETGDNETGDGNTTDGNTTADAGDTSGAVGDDPPAGNETGDGADEPAADAEVTEESPAVPLLALPLAGGAYLAVRRRRS